MVVTQAGVIALSAKGKQGCLAGSALLRFRQFAALGQAVHIVSVAVREDERRRGCAASLVTDICNRYVTHTLTLNIEPSLPLAPVLQQWVERRGFVRVAPGSTTWMRLGRTLVFAIAAARARAAS